MSGLNRKVAAEEQEAGVEQERQGTLWVSEVTQVMLATLCWLL